MLYTFMNKNTPILTCDIDSETDTIAKIVSLDNPEYLPISVYYQKDMASIGLRKALHDWWRNRSIPASRDGLSSALVELQIPNKDYLLLKGLGLSLSDQYWMNPNGSLIWKDVNYFDNEFSEDVGNALFGEPRSSENLDLKSPDNTSDGQLQKRWKIIDGERFLIKGGKAPYWQQPINEVVASHILRLLGKYSFTEYSFKTDKKDAYSVCKNFVTTDMELVSAWQIFQTGKQNNRTSKYKHFLSRCETLGILGMEDFMNYLLAFDYIIANDDRHLNNFGVLRDVNTLKWKGIAPIFDSGTSLWHDTITESINPQKEVLSTPLHRATDKQTSLITSFNNFDIRKLDQIGNDIEKILRLSPKMDPQRCDCICSAVENKIRNLSIEIERFESNKIGEKR